MKGLSRTALPLLLGTLSLRLDAAAAPSAPRRAALLWRFECGGDEGARSLCGAGAGAGGYAWLAAGGNAAMNASGGLFAGVARTDCRSANCCAGQHTR
jgi:hypothetical protein